MNSVPGPRIRFRGVRGTIPTPCSRNLRYGGNTSCVELLLPGEPLIILDAGTGIRSLGHAQEPVESQSSTSNVFFSHFHWDHIAGLPLYGPLYRDDHRINFHGSGCWGPLKTVLGSQMASPYFPVNFDFASARKEFSELDSAPVRLGRLTVHPFTLNHPQGALGYRMEFDNTVVVYATDYEHGHPKLDSVLRDHSQSADALIIDAQYTPEEHQQRRGWGHSTWLEATRVAREAGVRRLILFHHDPDRSDEQLDGFVASARREFENTFAASEGWQMSI
jgi:phosphoribosyl 1,2-cyclic phosphodiesterase